LDKRLLIVLPLCLVILFGWQAFAVKMGWIAPSTAKTPPLVTSTDTGAQKGDAPTAQVPAKPEDNKPAPPPISPVVADTEQRFEEFTIGTPGAPGYYHAKFSNRGAVLEELRTGNYFDKARLDDAEKADIAHWERLVSRLPGDDAVRSFSLRTTTSTAAYSTTPLETAYWSGARIENGVEYRYSPGQGLTFVKRWRFQPGSDQIRFELEISNDARGDAVGVKNFVFTPAAGVPTDTGDTYYHEPQAVAFSRARDGADASPEIRTVDTSGKKVSDVLPTGSPLSFAGLFNKYFAVVLRGADEGSKATLAGASWRAVPAEAGAQIPLQIVTDVDLALQIPPVGEKRTWTYDVYAGPKQAKTFDAAYADHKVILDHDLGYMRSLSKGLMWILKQFHALTSSWGMSIILLTILVRALLFPINRRAQTAMSRHQAKIKRLQPKLDEMKKRYADDPAKQRQEQARIMQEGDALMPPLGGCLPPFLQIPVFFGLMSAIRIPFELRQAPFMGWIHDLSLPDHLVTFAAPLPLIGAHLNILPPLMVVMWILQQRSMPMPTDDQAKMMYKMMMFMPIVMGVFLYNYAAGMSLYMIVTSSLAIIEQRVIKKYWPVDDTPPPPKKKAGFMARLMEQAQEQQKRREQEMRKKAHARR
jgi:YidC/Oxa1 family membrane protein insertase